MKNESCFVSNTEKLVTVGSWEPRFWLGFQQLAATHVLSEVFMYFYAEYAGVSQPNRQSVRDYCEARQIELHEQKLAFSAPIDTWRTLYTTMSEAGLSNQSVLVDITTM